MGKLDDAKRLAVLKYRRWVKWCENMRIWLPQKDYEEMKRITCSICGKAKQNPQIYFGEEICGNCKNELDPNGVYDKQIKGRMGFKGGAR